MPEHFVNEGYGWTCRRCGEETSGELARSSDEDGRARFFREGEAEEREGAALSSRTLARWRDEGARRFLRCPVCGVEEEFTGGR
jgi:rubrerythrin